MHMWLKHCHPVVSAQMTKNRRGMEIWSSTSMDLVHARFLTFQSKALNWKRTKGDKFILQTDFGLV